jgi:hypothetical protein
MNCASPTALESSISVLLTASRSLKNSSLSVRGIGADKQIGIKSNHWLRFSAPIVVVTNRPAKCFNSDRGSVPIK